MTIELAAESRDLLVKDMTIGPIVSPAIYQSKAEIRVLAKKILDAFVDYYKPKKAKKYQDWQDEIAAEQQFTVPLQSLIAQIDKDMGAWDQEQERLRREKEEQLKRQLIEQETSERLEEAIELEREGRTEEANALVSAPVTVPPVVVASSTPKVAGLTPYEHWNYRITDPAKIPRRYLLVDEAKIGREVQNMKNLTEIPGVEVFPETRYRSTNRRKA